MKTNNIHFLLFIAGLIVVLILFNSCDSTSADSEDYEVIDTVTVELPVHEGEVGLVIDSREIFRKGFIATEAIVNFPNHPDFNEVLAIDPVTNIAIMRILNEDLTEDQKNAFEHGVSIEILIHDENQTLLSEYQSTSQVLDDSGVPLKLFTNLVFTPPPLKIKEGVSYLLHPEGQGGLIRSGNGCSSCWVVDSFVDNDNIRGQFEIKFTPVEGETDTYYIEGIDWGNNSNDGEGTYFTKGKETLESHKDSDTIFMMKKQYSHQWIIEQDDDGWVRIIRAEHSNHLITWGTNKLRQRHMNDVRHGESARFRIITNNINWNMTDRGTVYHQPVMPPARVEFAYASTIRNCTSGPMTEQVGTSKSRTSNHTATLTESLKVFTSHEGNVAFGVTAALGGEIYGAKVSVNVSASYTHTRSNTSTTEVAEQFEDGETTTVSRTRSLEVLPFTVVEVYDAVRVVSGANVPFTQKFRLTAKYEDNNEPLTGEEIMSQLMFNMVSGVPSRITEDYVDISLRGQIGISEMYSTESGANEIPNGC